MAIAKRGLVSNAVNQEARVLEGTERDYDPLLTLIHEARFALLGEASHGTHEFYRERAEITKRLIKEKHFTAVAVEADWPEAYRVNRYVRGMSDDLDALEALTDFRRFPAWDGSRSTSCCTSLNSVRELHDELAAAGIRSKRRVRPDSTTYGGQKIARGALYLMLQNRIYRGEITHKGKSYPAEHPAIIGQPLWDEVQAVLAQNRVERATGARTKYLSLLGGFVFDATGGHLTPTYAIKKGTRYRYYVSSSLVREARGKISKDW